MEQKEIQEKKSFSFWRLIRRLFIGSLLLLIVLAGTAVTLVVVYEDEVKLAVIDELNKHLNAEVKIDPANIDLTVIKTFPNAAIEFKDAMAYEALQKKERDTLFTAGLIALRFNLMDLFHKNYHITRIDIKDGEVNLKVDKNGKENYVFWKSTKDTTGTSPVEFKLEAVFLQNLYVKYRNRKELVKVMARVKETTISGAFKDVNYLLSGSGDVFIDELAVNKHSFLNNKTVHYAIDADVKENRYTLKTATININRLELGAEGYVEKADTAWIADLDLKGKNIDIRSALSLLPESQQQKIKDYGSDGTFYAEGKLKGNLSDIQSLSIDAKFGVQNASISHASSDVKLTQVNLEGAYAKKKGSPEKLELKNVSALLNNNSVKGDFAITYFNDPYIELSTNGELNLEEALRFYPIDTISSLSGRIQFNAEINGSLNTIKTNFTDKANLSKGKLAFNDISLKFKNDEKLIKLQAGSLVLENNSISVDSISLLVGKSDALVNGKFENFILWLFKDDQRLLVDAKIDSKNLSLDELMAAGSAPSASSSRHEIKISQNINLNLNLFIAQTSLDKFSAKNITGNVKIKDKKMFTDNLSLETMNGDVALSGIIDASDEKDIEIKGIAKLVGIDVNKLFYQLTNFGQEAIQDKHLKGVATMDIDFSTRWNKLLECDLASIQVFSDLTIEQGELIDYKPLESLSKYVELKELQRIKFSTLQSHIDIKDKTIFITKTSIKNTALNVDLYGKHTFNNEINYHIKLLLGEILARRPGKSRELDEELATVENDPENKRCVLLTMTGTIDNPIIKYDRKGLKEKIKEDVKQEKQNLKQLLHEEFGWYKKDSASYKNKKEDKMKADQKFQIEFGGDKNKKTETKSGAVNETKKQEKGISPKKEEEEEDF